MKKYIVAILIALAMTNTVLAVQLKASLEREAVLQKQLDYTNWMAIKLFEQRKKLFIQLGNKH